MDKTTILVGPFRFVYEDDEVTVELINEPGEPVGSFTCVVDEWDDLVFDTQSSTLED